LAQPVGIILIIAQLKFSILAASVEIIQWGITGQGASRREIRLHHIPVAPLQHHR
jgi:hypothetical protein